MTSIIQIIVLHGCDNCGTQNLRPEMMICDACLERSRRREIAQRPIAIQAEDGYKLYRLEDGTYGDGDMRFINFYDIPGWVEVLLDPEDPRCPKCGGQMEEKTVSGYSTLHKTEMDDELDECTDLESALEYLLNKP